MLRPSVLSAALALALLPSAAPAAEDDDRDADGIPDEVEIAGVPGQPLLDFPAYGADPDVPDVFVQADWYVCEPTIEYCGPNNTFDQHKLSSAAAVRLARYFAPDVALHIDNGVEPGDPARLGVHGNWGGARRLPAGGAPCNADTLGTRFGTFHRGTTSKLGSGGGGDLFGFCFGGDSVNMGVLAQELGHNFGINHGGNPPSFPANCKPNYRSPMNYAYTYDTRVTQFSRGRFAAAVLDPTAMDERAGLGSADDDVREWMSEPPWEYLVREDGAIDWNRNGVIDEAPVRAAPTWAWASCEQSVEHSDFFDVTREPALAWLPDASAPRLYLVSRRGDDGTLTARFNTRFDGCDPASLESCTSWTPVRTAPARAVPGSQVGSGGLAAAGFTDPGGTAHVAVAYAGDQGKPVLQLLSLDGGGGEAWSAPEAIGSEAVDGDPALALAPGGQRLVFLAPIAGRLVRFERDASAAAAAWSPAREETWAGGAPIEVCAGAGLVSGFARGQGARLFMAVSEAPACGLQLAYYDETDAAWVRAGSFLNAAYPPFTSARPALAYAPFERATPEDGRFYLAWRPYPTGAGVISLSEGNDLDGAASARRLVFRRGTYIRNLWALLEGTVALSFDPRFDDNLRAAWVYANTGVLQFNPFADGVIAVQMKDQDDYAFILANLACSLDGSCSR